MVLNHRKKRNAVRFILAGTLIVALFAIVIIFVLPTWNEKKEKSSKSYENESKEEHTSEPVKEQYEDTTINKEYYIDYIYVGDEQALDNLVDVHIRFPNGEDYVVVACKNITNRTKEGFYMQLDEKELHMLSSAKTDKDVYEGTEIYLATYKVADYKGVVDYPWNQYVISSFGIMYDDALEVYDKRMQLEENLLTFMEQTLQK